MWPTFSRAPLLGLVAVVGLGMSCSNPVTGPTLSEPALQKAIPLVGQVSTDNLKAYLDDLDVVRSVFQTNGGTILAKVQDKITRRVQSWGYTLQTQTVECPATANGQPWTASMDNLFWKKEGSRPELAPLLVSAHWDSVSGGKGMDDNATGCALVLEASRVLQNCPLERSVIFVLYAFEEKNLLGSYAFCRSLDRAPAAVINMDAVGFTAAHPLVALPGIPDRGDFIAIVTRDWCLSLGQEFCLVSQRLVPALPFFFVASPVNISHVPFLNYVNQADQLPFWQQRTPALFLTDTALLRNPHYHQSSDTLETLDGALLTQVTQAVVGFAVVKADQP